MYTVHFSTFQKKFRSLTEAHNYIAHSRLTVKMISLPCGRTIRSA